MVGHAVGTMYIGRHDHHAHRLRTEQGRLLPPINLYREYNGKPFIKWAGGKQRQAKRIVELAGKRPINRYFEPFLGAASVYFSLRPNPAVLGDSNTELIRMYEVVKNQPDQLFDRLCEHASAHSIDHYYEARNEFNNGQVGIEKAAAFIYLNRAGFNGVYRVNRNGQYNVPFGGADRKIGLPTLDSIIRISRSLEHADLKSGDYQETASDATAGDLVYFDPPYAEQRNVNGFTKYTSKPFRTEDQVRLARFAHELGQRGCRVILTHGAADQIKELYKDWHIVELEVLRSVNPYSGYFKAPELMISNY